MALLARDTSTAGEADKDRSACAPAERMIGWLTALCGGQDGLVEMRVIGVSRHNSPSKHTESLLYAPDEAGIARLIRDARNLSPRAESVYFTINPVMSTVGTRTPSDKDIRARQWLFIDVDPERPARTSATDAEKALAKKVVDLVDGWLHDRGWPEPVRADSGNGFHLLYSIRLPNDDASTELVKRTLEVIAAQSESWPGVAGAKVDTSVYNASRICKLYGTIARKGEHTPERPHRTSRVIEIPEKLELVTVEQLRELCGLWATANRPATNGHTTNGKARKGIVARDLGSDPIEAYLTKALDEEIGELARSATGNRNNQLLKSSAALFELTGPDKLDEAEVYQKLRETARQIGLEPREIERTIKSARDRATPRNMDHVGKGKGVKSPSIADPITGVKEYMDDPHRLAREFLKAEHHHADGPTIRAWNEEWHVWRDGCWAVKSDREVNATLARFIKREFDRISAGSGREAKAVGTRLIGNVALAIRSLVTIPMHDLPEQPAWIDVDGPPPHECLATRSGILHLPTMALEPLTPRFFSPNVLTYGFDPGAPRPDSWLAFLDSVWGEDAESIACLQEWFGYLLTTDTRQQKILLMVGPRRSGKGTIANTIKALAGDANVAAPTLSSLGTRFGSQPLIGKTVAICAESRITGRSDSQAIVERLLSISGEDPQSIERKNVGNWCGALRCRFVLQGNELPRLGDYSSALPSRMILLKMDRSFYGREDHDLGARIRAELPGILWWAIAGWERLRDRGHFLQPRTGSELLKEFEELNNPMGAFIAERCDIEPQEETPVKRLYEAWKVWCEKNGRDHPGDLQGLGRNLKSAVSSIKTADRRNMGMRYRVFVGIRLNPEDAESF
jgi:putative DNA primase/helicase